MVDVLRTAGTVEIYIGAALATTFVILYQVLADWRRERLGPLLMGLMAVIAAVLDLSAIAQFAFRGALWFVALRVLVFGGVPVVLGWLLVLFLRTQADRRRLRLSRKRREDR